MCSHYLHHCQQIDHIFQELRNQLQAEQPSYFEPSYQIKFANRTINVYDCCHELQHQRTTATKKEGRVTTKCPAYLKVCGHDILSRALSLSLSMAL